MDRRLSPRQGSILGWLRAHCHASYSPELSASYRNGSQSSGANRRRKGVFRLMIKGEFVAHRILNSNSTSGITLSLDLSPGYTLKNMETPTEMDREHTLGVTDLGVSICACILLWCVFCFSNIRGSICLLLKQITNTDTQHRNRNLLSLLFLSPEVYILQ